MLYLASQSPRRYQLLKQLNVEFKQFSVDVDESVLENETPLDYIRRVTELKKIAACEKVEINDCVLVADTTVIFKEHIMGKPQNFDHAKEMLKRLSGNTHEVYTSVGLAQGKHFKMLECISTVTFREISNDEMIAYWRSGEPKDKAGAYAIQGIGSIFVESICGSYSAIMGLPLFESAKLLNEFGISVLN